MARQLLLLPAALLLLLLLAPARAGPAPAARELTSCDALELARPVTRSVARGSSVLVRSCSGFRGGTFSARVLNPTGAYVGVYLGVGTSQCSTPCVRWCGEPPSAPLFSILLLRPHTPPTPTLPNSPCLLFPCPPRFNPNYWSWTSKVSFDEGGTGKGTELWAANNVCIDDSNCCVQLVCLSSRSDCNDVTVSLAFVAPPSTPTACGGTSVAMAALPDAEFRTLSCAKPRGSLQTFSLQNPTGQRVSLMLTDGAGAQECGFTWGSGSTFNSYKSVQLSTATSFSFAGVPCEKSPCCASVSCQSGGGPCIGLSFVQSISDPPPIQPNLPPALLPGEIAALLISVLAVAVGVAFFFWHKGRKDQQLAAQAGAGAADAPQAQANPLQAFGSAQPPTAPQSAQAPVAAKAKAARAALSAIGGAVWGGDDSEE